MMAFNIRQREMRSAFSADFTGGANPSLPGPDDIYRTELDNGIVVLVRTNDFSPSVVLNGYLCVGSISDPDDKLGISDFTASALMRGTQQRDFHQIFDTLESAGANMGLESSVHTTSFWGRALAEDLQMLVDLLADVLRHPVFPAEQIERLRAQLLSRLAIRAQNTGEMASLAFDQIVYAGHPYRRPEDGYPETVQNISLEDMIEFHRQFYNPKGMTLAIVGAVDPQEAVDQISHYFADWQNPNPCQTETLPDVKPLEGISRSMVNIAGKSQSDVLIGAAGPERQSQDFMAAALGNSVLGQFGMMGRIGVVVREKAGLAYYASSSVSGGKGPGPWTVSAGVAPENIERAIDLILSEIKRFIGEPVSDEELSDSQANFIGRLPLSLESNSGVSSALINLERYNLGLDYYQRYADIVRAITPAEILETARRYLNPQKIAIAIAGPPVEKP
jgi:zinc protease